MADKQKKVLPIILNSRTATIYVSDSFGATKIFELFFFMKDTVKLMNK